MPLFVLKIGTSDGQSVIVMEICFVEYSFLSFAKASFAKNIANQISPRQVDGTVLTFGAVEVIRFCIMFDSTFVFCYDLLNITSLSLFYNYC